MSSDRKPGRPHDYKVGYGKPPKEHRFKKGQSGNPRGRPKGAKSRKPARPEERTSMPSRASLAPDGSSSRG